MTTAHVGLLVARTPKRLQQVPAADPWQTGQGTATSISTMSSKCSAGTGSESIAAASR
jgi:hypothetical protein